MVPKYKRVLLKLSGEALSGDKGFGLDNDVLNDIAEDIADILNECDVEIALVVGGGNFWRGLSGARKGMDRVQADYMGMLATVMNSLALQDALEAKGVVTRVQTAFEVKQLAEPYIRRRAIRHLAKGRVVIFAGGTGNPYFSTDTAAALRSAEIEADVLLMAKRHVDGVYDSDPRTNPDARLFDHIEYMDVLEKQLKVMDSTAATVCMDNDIPIIVFNLDVKGNIKKAIYGEKIGTIVKGGKADDNRDL